MEGTPFGRYQLLELLGRGGMGEVWRAYDTSIDRVVALKMLLPHYAQDPEFDKRFRREARAAARLDDPHVVPIHDVGEIDGRLYVTMRLINGTDLQTLLNAGPLDNERAVHIVEQIASALNDAHQVGLVHRDVKPSNILVSRNDFAYLIDFGIARGTGDTTLTSANTTIGTWSYMAPERFSTGDVEPSSDVYALACVLYQCLTGELPFPGTTLEQVAVSHMVMPPPRPSTERDTVPMALDEVIATGLAKKPTDRYQSTVEMAAAARQAITEPMGRRVARPLHPDPAQTQPAIPVSTAPATEPARFIAAPAVPPLVTPSTAGQPGRRRPRGLIGALAAVGLLIVAGGVFGAVTLSQRDEPTATTPSVASPGTLHGSTSAASAPAAPGPFTGTYRADFTPSIPPAGGPVAGTPQTATWGVRSVCRPDGCVATASRLSGENPVVSSLVFDEVDGSWVAVALGSDQCDNAPAEFWVAITLKKQPDGTFTGDLRGRTSNSCTKDRTVTFTRTGDVDAAAVPDPAALPPRVASPAQALHGRYRLQRTYADGSSEGADVAARTDCLRTGDRCMSFFTSPDLLLGMVFSNGNWTDDQKFENECPKGGTLQAKVFAQFPLPQPPQDPITLLSGRGHQEQTGSCPIITDFDETFTRTGD
ncbi:MULTISPECIES: serine/threonine-protein kinase [unclassified Mycobacterium]|uniref:serine/threonine-protein kinase n=1 Tax=unclassified Mycobacterium TaxID=2642494 RepID=UPI0029C78D63|nr:MULTISPECIES: protein kinase [unclassified Mycobacterium]